MVHSDIFSQSHYSKFSLRNVFMFHWAVIQKRFSKLSVVFQSVPKHFGIWCHAVYIYYVKVHRLRAGLNWFSSAQPRLRPFSHRLKKIWYLVVSWIMYENMQWVCQGRNNLHFIRLTDGLCSFDSNMKQDLTCRWETAASSSMTLTAFSTSSASALLLLERRYNKNRISHLVLK